MDQNEETSLISDNSAHPQMESPPQLSEGSLHLAGSGSKKQAFLMIAVIVVLGVALNRSGMRVPMLATIVGKSGTLYLQSIATKVAKDNLVKPCLQAEMYYNASDQEKSEYRDFIPFDKPNLPEAMKPDQPPPLGCEATIIMLRHCEKGQVREHCDHVGFQRAKYIASLFGNDSSSRWPIPSYLFALNPGERHNKHVQNMREEETLQPLSEKTGLPIVTSYGMKTKKLFSQHIFELLKSGEMCGKVAVVCWKHQDIPDFARSIGCGPLDGCPATWNGGIDFDTTWQISYSYHKAPYASFALGKMKNMFKELPQHPQWWISGHTQAEDFDPLEFSKSLGVYATKHHV